MLSGNSSRKNKGLSASGVSAAAAKSFQPFLTPCDPIELAHQAPLSIGFSRKAYRSGLPCPPPGDLPDTGIEPASLTSPADSLPSSATWEALLVFLEV